MMFQTLTRCSSASYIARPQITPSTLHISLFSLGNGFSSTSNFVFAEGSHRTHRSSRSGSTSPIPLIQDICYRLAIALVKPKPRDERRGTPKFSNATYHGRCTQTVSSSRSESLNDYVLPTNKQHLSRKALHVPHRHSNGPRDLPPSMLYIKANPICYTKVSPSSSTLIRSANPQR